MARKKVEGAEAPAEIAAGSVVKLRGGGPPLTVGQVQAGRASVAYFDAGAVLRTEWVQLAAVEAVRERAGGD